MRSPHVLAAALLLAALPLAGASGCDDVVGPAKTATITGRVVDGSDGRAVAGATISVGYFRRTTSNVLCEIIAGHCDPSTFFEEGTGTTGADGRFRITYERFRATHLSVIPTVNPATYRQDYYAAGYRLSELPDPVPLARLPN